MDPDSKKHEEQADKKEAGRDDIGKNAHVRIAMVREQIDREKEQVSEYAAHYYG